METIQQIGLISTNPEVRGGRPCIVGTSLEVSVIAIARIAHNQSAEEIAADYDLTLPQVYAALAYYYKHKEEIDRSIQERRNLAAEMKEKQIGSRHPPLLG